MYSAQSAPISRAVQSLALPAGVTAMTLLLLLTLLLPIALAAQERPDSITRAALPEVVISASGFEQSRRDAPASITVISRQQLEQQRTSELADVLRGVEGIDVGGTSGKTGGLNVSLRGMPAEYTLILVDGRRQNAAGNVTPNGFRETETSFLPPPSAIERVEIIRGPMATLYGSDAMGGVINIITRKTRSSWSGSLSTDATLQEESEFGNSFGATTWISGPVISERLTLDLRGSVFQRREATLSPSGEFGDGTQISARGPSPVRADRHSIGSKLAFAPSANHDIWADYNTTLQRYDNRQGQLGTLDQPDADPATFNGYGPHQRFNREQIAAGHTWRFGRGVVESSVMHNTTETVGRTLPAGTPGGPPGSGAPDKPAGSPRTLESANLVADSKITTFLGAHVLTAGGQWWDAEMIDGVALQPFQNTQWALFAENEWRMRYDLALTLGVRRDEHSVFGGQTSPRAYLVWNATPEWTFKGGVSRGYKTPRVEQLVDGIIGFTGQGRIATIGTPSLRPETSTSSEVGVHYAGFGAFSGNVTLFNNDFRNRITSGTPIPNCTFEGAPDLPGCLDYGNFPTQESFSQSVNVDEAVTRGVEAGVRVVPYRGWLASGSYTYTHSEQLSGEAKGLPLQGTPAHMVNGNLRVQLAGNTSAWLGGEYRSSRPRSTSPGTNLAQEALGDYRGYSLFHLGGSWSLMRGLTINATIYNLLNKDFREYASYQGAPTASNPSGILYSNLYNNHQDGRRLWLSTTVEW